MEKKKSSYEILAHWLKLNKNDDIPTHKISTDLPYYGLVTFNVMYSPENYSRKFREIKASKALQRKFGISIEEIEQGSRENYYKITEVEDGILS